MKKRVLFIFATPINHQFYATTLPPLGMLGLASYLESKGFVCDVIDYHVMDIIPDYREYSAVCFSVNIANIKNTKKFIDEAREKNPDAKIIVGGPFTENKAKLIIEYLKPDYITIGDAELTLLEILTKRSVIGVKGLMARTGKGIEYFGPREPALNLDQFPFPALNKVPIEKYNFIPKKNHPISSIMTSRGCPNKCIFCYHNTLWRQRSPKHVVDEIEWQVNVLHVKEIVIMDENFTLNRKRVMEICELILKRKIKVSFQFGNGVRADRLDYEMLKKLKEVGLWLVALAPEVGYASGLKKIKKDFTHHEVETAIGWCKQLGLITYAFFSIGYPWENAGNVRETSSYSLSLDTDLVQFTRATPIEGTELYSMLGLDKKEEIEDIAEEGFFLYNKKYELPHITQDKLTELIKESYKRFYMRPGKMISLLMKLRPDDILNMVKFSLTTKSMY